MNCLLAGLNWICCLVYLDDVIVFSRTFEEHLHRLDEVLTLFTRADIMLKPSKCRFAVSNVEYLGHIVSAEGIAPDPRKVEKLLSLPTPTNPTEVRGFLGLPGYYRRFVRNFSVIAAPLFDLLKEKHPWKWTASEEGAKRQIIDAIRSDAMLPHPRFDLPFVVDTDASDVGLGAVLSQVIDGVERPIMFASRRIQPAESKWHIREKEALGIIFALETFRHFLLGSDFEVRTDHRSLEWLKEAKTGRLCRWALRLGEFGDFDVSYRPGEKHANADAFTRIYAKSDCVPDHAVLCLLAADPWMRACPGLPKPRAAEPTPVLLTAGPPPEALSLEELGLEQGRDPVCQRARLLHEQGKRPDLEEHDGILGVRPSRPDLPFRPLLPAPLLERVVKALHCPPEHGHLGTKRVTALVKSRYFVANAAKRVGECLQACLNCARRKPAETRQGVLASQMPTEPWRVVSGDFCGPYVRSGGDFLYILVLFDNFTKWVELIPCHDATAKTVCQAFYNRVICRHGTPHYFLSDRGTHFKAGMVEALCATFGVRKIFSSAYYPQGDGYAERFMRTLNNSLSALAGKDPANWDKFVAGIAFAYNATPHAGTGLSPFMLNHGREPRLKEDLWRPLEWSGPQLPRDAPDYLDALRATMDDARAQALASLSAYYERYRERYNNRERLRDQVGWDTTIAAPSMDYQSPPRTVRQDPQTPSPYVDLSPDPSPSPVVDLPNEELSP